MDDALANNSSLLGSPLFLGPSFFFLAPFFGSSFFFAFFLLPQLNVVRRECSVVFGEKRLIEFKTMRRIRTNVHFFDPHRRRLQFADYG